MRWSGAPALEWHGKIGFMKRLTSVLMHAILLAIVCAIAAYWAVKVMTPQPSAAPPPLAAPPPREPDAMLAARMFGLVQAPQAQVATNVQVAGVFAAGKDSSAVLVVDGKPARVYLVGQEVAPGTKLAEVTADTVVLASDGGRQEVRLPARPVAALAAGNAPPPRAYVLEGKTLSAPPNTPPGALPRPAVPQDLNQPGLPLPGQPGVPVPPPPGQQVTQ